MAEPDWKAMPPTRRQNRQVPIKPYWRNFRHSDHSFPPAENRFLFMKGLNQVIRYPNLSLDQDHVPSPTGTAVSVARNGLSETELTRPATDARSRELRVRLTFLHSHRVALSTAYNDRQTLEALL